MREGLIPLPAKLSIRPRKIEEVICTRREITLPSYNVSYPSVFSLSYYAHVSSNVTLVCVTHACATAISFVIMHVPSTDLPVERSSPAIAMFSLPLTLHTHTRDDTTTKLVRENKRSFRSSFGLKIEPK